LNLNDQKSIRRTGDMSCTLQKILSKRDKVGSLTRKSANTKKRNGKRRTQTKKRTRNPNPRRERKKTRVNLNTARSSRRFCGIYVRRQNIYAR